MVHNFTYYVSHQHLIRFNLQYLNDATLDSPTVTSWVGIVQFGPHMSEEWCLSHAFLVF